MTEAYMIAQFIFIIFVFVIVPLLTLIPGLITLINLVQSKEKINKRYILWGLLFIVLGSFFFMVFQSNFMNFINWVTIPMLVAGVANIFFGLIIIIINVSDQLRKNDGIMEKTPIPMSPQIRLGKAVTIVGAFMCFLFWILIICHLTYFSPFNSSFTLPAILEVIFTFLGIFIVNRGYFPGFALCIVTGAIVFGYFIFLLSSAGYFFLFLFVSYPFFLCLWGSILITIGGTFGLANAYFRN